MRLLPDCGHGKYYEDCRACCTGDTLAEHLYCVRSDINDLVVPFDACESCSLVNYGRDCRNNVMEVSAQ
ncbi:MAG TPA: hypothetical protein ENH40_06760 [Nitrospirae bacterium]|nr:hypothetical protein [Nitrospirota bacterium]HDZ62826.1 hypothetical protein [Nitrospirota bacterium]